MRRSMLSVRLGFTISISIALGVGHGNLAGQRAQEGRDGTAARNGRRRPAMPRVTHPVLHNTPEADRILAALQVYPADNPWNEDISNRPVHPSSKKLIASIGPEKQLAYNLDMAFILVPPDQKKVAVRLTGYRGESDPGPYPVPDQTPIEDWPLNGKPLDVIQREGRGDRHMLV